MVIELQFLKQVFDHFEDAKRIIGRQYEDAAVTKDRRLWSFDVVRESRPPDDVSTNPDSIFGDQNYRYSIT